jgi:hypothetical protein
LPLRDFSGSLPPTCEVSYPFQKAALVLLFLLSKNEKTMSEEVFFLFIASCIGLWLIQLATEWIDRRRIKRGTVMKRYRGHLILVKAHQEPDTDDWKASIHVQFNEGSLTFRDVHLPTPPSYFSTKTAAEKRALKEAKWWIDSRLREAKRFGR